MPYINKEARERLDFEFCAIAGALTAESAGELNYLFTKILTRYIDNKELSYQTINDIIGALEGAKLEFYRRKVIPYENLKCLLNGEVYD